MVSSGTDRTRDELISTYREQLYLFKRRKAIYGLASPPHLLMKIEDVEEKIKELNADLKSRAGLTVDTPAFLSPEEKENTTDAFSQELGLTSDQLDIEQKVSAPSIVKYITAVYERGFLRAYPADFHAEFGPIFQDRCLEAYNERGLKGLAKVCFTECRKLPREAFVARRQAARERGEVGGFQEDEVFRVKIRNGSVFFKILSFSGGINKMLIFSGSSIAFGIVNTADFIMGGNGLNIIVGIAGIIVGAMGAIDATFDVINTCKQRIKRHAAKLKD